MAAARAGSSVWAFVLALGLSLGTASCSIFATRPVQEMSDAAAAIRAAREVQAETLSPEYFRQANEWFGKARREYKFRNFHEARAYIKKARRYAEQAEFEAIRANGTRAEASPEPHPENPSASESHVSSESEYATPTPIPAGNYVESAPPEPQPEAGASPGPTKIEVPNP
ncbi:MAG: DUF4398 domain-containing protein [Oligoflexia bacterium]|nr:DUF4398 domain-containing protein [Oligoflexia bacterium]